MPELVNFAEYARRRGVSGEAVRKAIATGRITVVRDAAGRARIDPEVADIQWAKNTDPGQSARANSPKMRAAQSVGVQPSEAGQRDSAAYWDARTRREVAEASKAELELQKLERTLVSADQVRAAASQLGRILRDSLMGLPSRIAPELAAADGPAAVESRLSAAIRGILEDVAKMSADDVARVLQ